MTGGDEVALVRALVARERGHMTSLRRHLHRNPELSYQEHETAARIEHELRAVGFAPTRPTGTSVMCRVSTGRPGPVLVLRADMDALPVREATGHSFASRNDGVMHACGHDGHMAVLVGVARAVSAIAGQLTGEVRLLFQHAEEPLPSGAPELIEKGVLDGADTIVGLHLWSSLPLGRICASAGPLMASTDYFDITITGRGGHAGLPHDTVDPIAAGAQAVTALQQIVARESDPADALVVAVTGFHGGEHNAVVPGTARLYGTVRALDERVRRTTADRITQIARSVAAAHRAEAEVTHTFGSPVVVNDPTLAAVGQRVVRHHLGDDALIGLAPVMAGEDFAWYQERVPGLFFLVGAGTPGQPGHPHHHPRSDFDEDALGVGLTLLLGMVLAQCGGSPRR